MINLSLSIINLSYNMFNQFFFREVYTSPRIYKNLYKGLYFRAVNMCVVLSIS